MAVVVIVVCPAAAPLLLAIAKGILMGAAIGGTAGGLMSHLNGESIWDGIVNGAFAGALAGGISGGMGFIMATAKVALGGTAALSFGQTLFVGGASSAGASLFGDIGDILFKGESISFGQVITNMAVSATFGIAFSGIFFGVAKAFTTFRLRSDANSGSVRFTPPRNNRTPENITQTKGYVRGCNDALRDGALSSSGRVSTQGQLRSSASNAARTERAIANAAGTPYRGDVGHVPDTTWTGSVEPYLWMDLNSSVNRSLGAQALNYPIGYQPTRFIYHNPWDYNLFKAPPTWGSSLGSILNNSINK